MMFKDTADVNQRLGKQQYIASDEIATVVYLAQSLVHVGRVFEHHTNGLRF